MEKDFIIGQVGWLTKIKRNYEYDTELCYQAFKNIINYLQDNDLTTHTILTEGELVSENTNIKLSDLTDDGFMLIKKCFDKWIANVTDRRIEPTNYKMLDNALKKIRLDK